MSASSPDDEAILNLEQDVAVLCGAIVAGCGDCACELDNNQAISNLLLGFPYQRQDLHAIIRDSRGNINRALSGRNTSEARRPVRRKSRSFYSAVVRVMLAFVQGLDGPNADQWARIQEFRVSHAGQIEAAEAAAFGGAAGGGGGSGGVAQAGALAGISSSACSPSCSWGLPT
jgi:hypothetical protein